MHSKPVLFDCLPLLVTDRNFFFIENWYRTHKKCTISKLYPCSEQLAATKLVFFYNKCFSEVDPLFFITVETFFRFSSQFRDTTWVHNDHVSSTHFLQLTAPPPELELFLDFSHIATDSKWKSFLFLLFLEFVQEKTYKNVFVSAHIFPMMHNVELAIFFSIFVRDFSTFF